MRVCVSMRVRVSMRVHVRACVTHTQEGLFFMGLKAQNSEGEYHTTISRFSNEIFISDG